MSAVVLGVEGAGVRTHALVCDESGRVLGAAESGPSNWEIVGIGGAGAALRVAVAGALEQADIRAQDIDASVFGLGGIDWPSDLERLAHAIEPLELGGPSQLVNDSFVALRAGASDPWGVVVVAGTGTVAAGVSPSGETFRTLGLGALLGDFGGENDVSVEAVRAVAAAYTGLGPATRLTEILCAHLAVATAAEVLERVSRREHGGRIEDEVEAFAPAVVAAAAEGDPVARSILDRAGAALGEVALLVARKLDLVGGEFELVLAGSLFDRAARLVSDPLEVVVRPQAPGAVIVFLTTPPVVGAVLMALDGLGVRADPTIRSRVATGAAGALFA